jgi:ATP/maltotriose-dependent transcriptional regulator MalT
VRRVRSGPGGVNRGIPQVCDAGPSRCQAQQLAIQCWSPRLDEGYRGGFKRHVFGRDAERTRGEQMLDAAAAGPVGLALEGAPGIGKTTVWRTVVESARDRGYQVVAAAPAEPDAALAFAGLSDLLDDLPAEIHASLPTAQRQALTVALLGDDADTGQILPDAPALPRATLNVLRRLSANRPLLVAIDDEQWLDRPTARVLAFALCRLRDEPICVLLSRRPASDGALWPELSRGFGRDGLPVWVLRPLAMSAIHRLLADRLDRPIAAPLLRRIHEVSGGNPLYALAIARELSGSTAVGDDQVPIPGTLTGAIARRLERLDASAADPLLAVASLSSPTLALIQAALPGFTLRDLDSAERAGVIELAGDRLRFTHPLLASTHYALTPAPRRRELHRLLAGVVADEEERAHHLALGAEAPDRQIAVWIEHAARRATRRGAPEVAAQLLEHSARLTPADATEASHSRIIAAAAQHKAAGDLKRARSLLEMVLRELGGGAPRARALKQLAQLRTDDLETASALLADALAEAGDHHRVAAEIEAQLAEAWVNRGDHAAAVEHSKAAVEHAERANDPGLLAHILGQQGVMAFFHGKGIQHRVMQRAIELEEHAEDTPSYYLPSTSLGLQLLWSDELDAARPLLDRALRRANERGEEYDINGLGVHLAHLEWEGGNREAAERFTAETLEAVQQHGDAQITTYVLWLQAFVSARHGKLDEARTCGNDAVEAAGKLGDNFIVAFSTAILAAIDLWSRQPGPAHERLTTWREAMVGDDRGFVGALTIPLWSCDVEALIALGRHEEASVVLEHLHQRARLAQNPNAIATAHRCEGLLLAARGDLGRAIEAMHTALAEHMRRPLPLEHGRTLLEKGTIERRARRKSAAKQSLEQALNVLEPLQATMWVERARDELGRVGLRRSTPDEGLTSAERRVAELVLAGMSNREIADTLYMSLRTVETHLTKVYRKLGVRSRAQLIATISAGSSQKPSLT